MAEDYGLSAGKKKKAPGAHASYTSAYSGGGAPQQYYPPAASAPKQGMHMELGTFDRMEQHMMITAPVFGSTESAKKHALKEEAERARVPEKDVLEIVSAYVSHEDPDKPYTDEQLAELLSGRGIEASRFTVIAARKELGLAASVDRYR